MREIERQSPSDPRIDFTDARLGSPVPVAHVGLDALRAYRAGDDPRTLVAGTANRAYLYPVLVDDQVRSSVVVHRHGDEWKPEVFGQAHRARQVDAIHRRLEADNAAIGVTLVEVPGIPAEFLSHDVGADLFLTPLRDVPRTGLVAGTTVPAADAFTQLQVVAATKPGR